MRSVALYEMLFGATMLVFGVLGYVQADSIASLVAGGVAGLILIIAALAMQKGSRPALYTCLIVTLALVVRFGIALAQGGGFYPSGLVLAMAVISLLLIGLLLVQPKERRRIF